LFVFARAVNGPKIPLAVLNIPAKNLPYHFSLDDTMAMMPQLKLSNFEEIMLVARLSKTGSAIAQSGDLQGGSKILHPGAREVRLIIDGVVP
jgi:cytochrome c-type biogenesis protein CcmH